LFGKLGSRDDKLIVVVKSRGKGKIHLGAVNIHFPLTERHNDAGKIVVLPVLLGDFTRLGHKFVGYFSGIPENIELIRFGISRNERCRGKSCCYCDSR